MIQIASGSGASSELNFGPGISDNDLWFVRSGNNLQIDLMGTRSQITVNNWFTSSSSQINEITAGGMTLDTKVGQLVQAMATYSSSNPGFDPTAISQAPNDPNLQGAISDAWHK